VDVNQTLIQRNNVHGDFFAGAVTGQNIEAVMHATPNWEQLHPGQKEALRVISQKIARILHGDPNFSDHWHDISGYAAIIDKKLVAVNTRPEAVGEVVADSAEPQDNSKPPLESWQTNPQVSPALRELLQNAQPSESAPAPADNVDSN
jgi:hypothetical protein